MPFAVAQHDGVLTLTLDTPRSTVNIFNHATARQLVEILSDVTPHNTRAIVFETAKPGSFINGVGLLLAHAAQTADGIATAAAPAWAAYRAVREAPVPTIAVIQGNCFGCGVEFAMQCRYRLASDRGDTRFYMTELNDYRFLPLFGSTWTLPEAVGLHAAIDLLLWGERWDARIAGAHGLVDAVAAPAALADERDRFVRAVIDGTQLSRRRGVQAWTSADSAVVEAARTRIAALPPAIREVYTAGLDLLVRGAQQTESHDSHQARELTRSAASALAPVGKAAFAFFYVRQMAHERAVGRLPRDDDTPALAAGAAVDAFAAPLRAQAIPGIRWTTPDAATLHLVASDGAQRGPRDVVVQLQAGVTPAPGVSLYRPTAGSGRLIEIALRDDPTPTGVAALARVLQRHGYEIARTTPAARYASDTLLVAFLVPLLQAAVTDADPARINATLCSFGTVHRPHAGLAAAALRPFWPALATRTALPIAEVAARLARLTATSACDASLVPHLIDALCLSLLASVLSLRADHIVRDAPTIDLLARELFDFPLEHISLCRWLTRRRVAAALANAAATGASPATIHLATAFVAEGRDLYR